MPDIEGRGLKIALDHHGERVDPDTQSRLPTAAEAEVVQKYVGTRFPALRKAPVVETRDCQYENTSNGDFSDRPTSANGKRVVCRRRVVRTASSMGPQWANIFPRQILVKAAPEPRYSLATKETVRSIGLCIRHEYAEEIIEPRQM